VSDLEGYSQLQARLHAIGQTQDMMRQVGLATVAGAKRTVAHKTRTTSKTIRLASYDKDSARVVAGGAGVFLELGTRPHIIRPKSKKALRWPAKGTATTLAGRARTGAVRSLGRGAYAFAKLVHHPGTKAQPFLVPSAEKALSDFGLAGIVKRWNDAA
jgi:hypothetical protein